MQRGTSCFLSHALELLLLRYQADLSSVPGPLLSNCALSLSGRVCKKEWWWKVERWLKLQGQGWVPACRGAVMGWETLATPSDEQQVDLLSLEVIKKPEAACPPRGPG